MQAANNLQERTDLTERGSVADQPLHAQSTAADASRTTRSTFSFLRDLPPPVSLAR